tara:strand:+ start:6583 stop:6774 length:192 start_codon:yes stop_codon:yes gene_type:complete
MSGIKKYILTIAYDEDNEEVEYMSEEIVSEEGEAFYYGDMDMGEHWDEETLEWLKDVYIIGES